MMWNIFSSKESTLAFWALSNLLLSNTHFLQLHAGHTFLQALQRIHLLSSFWKNANFSSGLIASIFSTSAKRSASFVSFDSPMTSSKIMWSFPLQTWHLSSMASLYAHVFSP